MSEIEKLMKMRRMVFLAMGVAFLIWQGGGIIEDIYPKGSGISEAADKLELVGNILFFGVLAIFLYYQNRIKKAQAENVLMDEYWQRILTTVAKTGFLVLFFSILLAFSFNVYSVVSASILLRSFLLIGMVVPLFHIVWLDRPATEGD